ncbi:AAA family ATPase, partial [Streptomyces collinus]|uniref:AAA family ATPase n=1 Tax=Streptomyces collinus TaxID=42684 RepID=UPI0037B0F866
MLIGRNTELSALDEFAGSETQWLWIKGDPFAGKTALLAWFALHPQDRVDVVACFLRRTTGENTAEYALDVLTRQLAVVADWQAYLPPPFTSDRANDFIDLVEEAREVSAQRRRRLLLLIDGLDEYDPTSAKLASWLPDATTLPYGVQLLVSSRSGADVHIPSSNPLFNHEWIVAASEAAIEIQHAAYKELDYIFDQSSKNPGSFIYPMICCLAAADSGLTAGELSVLVKRRGRDADIGEINSVLESYLRRSLVRVPEPGGTGGEVYAFAHETLLTEARVRCSEDLTVYEDLLDAWACEYVEQEFPINTPRYLLTPYTRELSRRSHEPAMQSERCRRVADQLFLVVAHRARLLRLFEHSGNPAVPDQEITVAQQTILDTRYRSGLDPDEVLFRLSVLALRRRPLTAIRPRIAARVAVVWAYIDRFNSALDLVACIEDPSERATTLSEVARALVVAHREDQAASAAEQAQQAAADIDTPADRARALNEAARVLATAHREDQAASAAEQAQQAAADIDTPADRARAL